MDKRCDQFPNCDDFSDERNCQLIVASGSYVKDFTPFTLDKNGDIDKVKLDITIELNSILEINEKASTLTTQFQLHMTWFDFRLKFYNMKVWSKKIAPPHTHTAQKTPLMITLP